MLTNIERSHVRYIILNFTEGRTFVMAYENSLFSVFTAVDKQFNDPLDPQPNQMLCLCILFQKIGNNEL
jgi:hypothetical protein